MEDQTQCPSMDVTARHHQPARIGAGPYRSSKWEERSAFGPETGPPTLKDSSEVRQIPGRVCPSSAGDRRKMPNLVAGLMEAPGLASNTCA
jgi:hypothetical protein